MESPWGRDFPPVQTCPRAHPASCTVGTRSFPGVKCGRGVLLTTHPLLVPRSWKSRVIPIPPSGPHQACNGIILPLPFFNLLVKRVSFLSNCAFAIAILDLISLVRLWPYVIMQPKQLKYSYSTFSCCFCSIVNCIGDGCLEVLITLVTDSHISIL